jgi:hypothetical protein
MQMLLWRKIFEDGECPSLGLFAAPYLELQELSSISYVKPTEKSSLWAPEWNWVSSLRWDAKIKKFDTETKFRQQTKGLGEV